MRMLSFSNFYGLHNTISSLTSAMRLRCCLEEPPCFSNIFDLKKLSRNIHSLKAIIKFLGSKLRKILTNKESITIYRT